MILSERLGPAYWAPAIAKALQNPSIGSPEIKVLQKVSVWARTLKTLAKGLALLALCRVCKRSPSEANIYSRKRC